MKDYPLSIMKQFYLLLIVGLLLSGFVLLGPRLRGRGELLDQLITAAEGPTSIILLAFFDLSIALASLVWVGPKSVLILQNLFPSLALFTAGLIFSYRTFVREFPHYKAGRLAWVGRILATISEKSHMAGSLCVIMAFIHFFAESIILL